jgi:hypothetical protein
MVLCRCQLSGDKYDELGGPESRPRIKCKLPRPHIECISVMCRLTILRLNDMGKIWRKLGGRTAIGYRH